jgi:hypothetical protein
MAKKQEVVSEATKERMKKMNAKADEDVSVESFESDSTSERQFHQKFMKIYKYVRKSLVILNARKVSKKETGEDLYQSALDVLENAKTL